MGYRVLRRLLPLLLLVGLGWLLVRRLDGPELVGALAHADYRLLVAAVALNLTVNTWARTERYRTLLRPLPRRDRLPGVFELARIILAGLAASNVLPGRVGEALRVMAVSRRYGIELGAAVAAQLVEKVVELMSFALLAVVASFDVRGQLAQRLAWVLIGASLVVVAAVVLLGALAGPSPRARRLRAAGSRRLQRMAPRLAERVGRFAGRLTEAFGLLGAPRTLLRATLWSSLSDLADAAMIGLCLHAVGMPLPPSAWVVVLVAINFAIALPSTPGQVGLLEAGAVAALVLLGATEASALAAALLYHACHFVPCTTLGLIEIAHMGGLRRLRADSDEEPARRAP